MGGRDIPLTRANRARGGCAYKRARLRPHTVTKERSGVVGTVAVTVGKLIIPGICSDEQITTCDPRALQANEPATAGSGGPSSYRSEHPKPLPPQPPPPVQFPRHARRVRAI
eukprot:1187637-Prorocentrum_minimum.AAC.1